MFVMNKMKINPLQVVRYTSNTKDIKEVLLQNDDAESVYNIPDTWSKIDVPVTVQFDGESQSTKETEKCSMINHNLEEFIFTDSLMIDEDMHNLNNDEENKLQETTIKINLGLSDFIFENFQDSTKVK